MEYSLVETKKRELEIEFAFDVYDFSRYGTVNSFYVGEPNLKTINDIRGQADKEK